MRVCIQVYLLYCYVAIYLENSQVRRGGIKISKGAHHIDKDIDNKEKNLEGDRAPPLPPPNKAMCILYDHTLHHALAIP